MVKEKGEVGDVYIASTGTIYSSDEITPETVENTRQNIYGKGISRRLQSLIFPDEYTLTVIDPDGNIDEEQSTIVSKMCDDVRMWAQMQKAYDDTLWHGVSIFNDVWGKAEDSNAVILKKLRHLPADSFTIAPPGVTTIYARRLQGIALNKEGEVECWQTNSEGKTVLIENAAIIMNPTSRYIDGDPELLPLIPIIDMLKYTWNSQMQQVNRVGAKVLFIKVTEPQPASTKNGNVGDIEYANILLQNWGKDTAFQLRQNMELVDLNIKDDSNNLEVIGALYNMVIDYISPAGFIARQGENGLAGGEKEREKLLSQVISAIHGWIEEQFEILLNRYFTYNSFPPGWHIEISIPSPRIDQTDANLKKAELCLTYKILPPSRVLELLDMDPLTDEEIQELIEFKSAGETGAPGIDENGDFMGQSKKVEDKITAEMTTQINKEFDKLEKPIIKSLGK